MFKDEKVRQEAIALAAAGNVGAMRQVIDDFNERLGAFEAVGGGAPATPPPEPLGKPGQIRMVNADGTAAEWVDLPASAPAEVSLDEKIAIAIRALPEDAFGANGKPKVPAIEAALGENITAADRDRVWAAMQEEGE